MIILAKINKYLIIILLLIILLSGCSQTLKININKSNDTIFSNSSECPAGLSVIKINNTGIYCSERSIKLIYSQ